MTDPLPEFPGPASRDWARKKKLLNAALAVLVVCAVLALVLPGNVALPLRLTVAFTDLAAAAAIWLLVRQKFGPNGG